MHTLPHHTLVAALLLLPVACTGPTQPGASDVDGGETWPHPEGAWVTEVTRDPASFATLMEATGREGWIALHANRLEEAAQAFPGDDPRTVRSRARAQWSLGVLQDDLARLTGVTAQELFTTWEKRGSVPEDSAAPAIAVLAELCYGGDAATWDPERVAQAWDAVSVQLGPEADAPWLARAELHAQAHQGDLAPLVAVATQPLVVEDAEGFQRTFPDPCLHRTLSDVWLQRAASSLGGTDWHAASAWATPEAGVESRLFAPWLTPEDLSANLKVASHPGDVGANLPSLASLGVDWKTPTEDDFQLAREEVRELDAALEQWKRALSRQATPEGKELLLDLSMTERFRQEFLTARARAAIRQGRHRTALSILELTRDVSASGVGPTNSPSLLALFAEAQLRLGHTREALDTLQVLSEAHPEVTGLKELAGDLAVLQGLDRQGDSKEN